MEKEVGKNNRNSSLELLRIICMIFIILYHYVIHGIMVIDIQHMSTFNGILTCIMLTGGRLSCDVFVLITGYFLIKQKFNVKRILKLIIKLCIYSVSIYIILRCFNLVDTDTKTLKEQLLSMVYGNWFVVHYVIIYILSPFLNKMINCLDKVSHFRLICILILVWSIIPTFTEFTWSFSSIDAFLVMYIIGAYIRLYSIGNKDNKLNILILSIGLVLLTIISVFMSYKMSPFQNAKDFFWNLNNLFMVIVAIYLFKVFQNMEFVNRPINYIAGSVLGIYLIHDNNILRPIIWFKIYNNMKYINSNYYIFNVIIKLVCIFIACLIIDKIVTKILDFTVYKLIDKLKFEKLKKFYNNVENKILNVI